MSKLNAVKQGDQVTLNAADLYNVQVDQRSVNQVLRDDGFGDADMAVFWARIGFPYQEGASIHHPITSVLQNAAYTVVAPTPLAENMRPADLKEFFRQRGVPEHWIDEAFRKIELPSFGDKIMLGNLLVRLLKGVASPDTLQG